jgi:hypothetical protein
LPMVPFVPGGDHANRAGACSFPTGLPQHNSLNDQTTVR